MRLGVSSAAAPRLSLPALVEAATRRGLSEIELVLGDGHGVMTGAAGSGPQRRDFDPGPDGSGVRIAALALPDEHRAEPRAAMELAARLGIPLLTPIDDHDPAAVDRLLELALCTGTALLLMHGTDTKLARRLRLTLDRAQAGAVGLAWQVDPGRDDARAVPAVLDAVGDALRYVRLRGGGPEAEAQSGMGVGALMARLALARYAGPLVLTPSSPRFHVAWGAWLGRRGGWGCGSRRSDPSLVMLAPEAHT